MKTEVAILHHEYPSSIRENVVAKLQHLLRFYEGTVSVRAVLERQHDRHRVELIANVRKGVVLVIEARRESITAALDEAIDRMARSLSRHKQRVKDPRRRSRAVVRSTTRGFRPIHRLRQRPAAFGRPARMRDREAGSLRE